MKVLKLLKILRDDYIHGELDKDINEAIKELEEAMKPKTCEGCKYVSQESIQAGNRLMMQDARYKYFCTERRR